ncbi:hypothetical protein [Microbacterium album]|uniref:Membrane protein n=1 Tax=Microbacterium album TaxID=2053191 RepID=A0A917IET8_9MICO|nr:hypothetical protein [Microbacterium album]GGH41970.1 membrane protein [Microbacterium album]
MRSTRSARAAASALSADVALLAVSLSGCASAAPGEDPADLGAIAERANAVGVAPELVYTTELDGYRLAPQSVGVVGAEGLSASWFNEATGAVLTIRSEHGELTAASCPETPLWDALGGPVTCTEQEGVWHRTLDGTHEYVAVRDGASIRVTGMNNAPQAELLAAAKAVRVPSEAELEGLFSDAPRHPAGPVERGDLPDHGDGAPIDPSGPGG